MAQPYVLALTSHKGGTGRTSLALALASLWSRQGFRVTLVDADPSRASRLIAFDNRGECHWERFTWTDAPLTELDPNSCELVVLDAPVLTSPGAQLLSRANGVLLTCLSDLMTLRTFPLATSLLSNLCRGQRQLEFHGLVLNRFQEGPIASRILKELCRMEDDLVLHPEIPEDAALRNWAGTPGATLPDGPAAEALAILADTLAMRMGLLALA